jgi:hypothetical protein
MSRHKKEPFPSRECPFKIDWMERIATVLILILFALTFMDKNNIPKLSFHTTNVPMLIVFYIAGGLIITYYFAFYRKHPSYVKTEGAMITIHRGIFFRPVSISNSEIKNVVIKGRSIHIFRNNTSSLKPVCIHAFLLSDDDRQALVDILEPFIG